MSIQDLGSIGELIAAIATVATLIYLSVQIRHNTRTDEAAAMDKITADVADFSLHILKDEKMQSVFTGYLYNGVDFDSLDAKGKLEVRMVLQTVFIMAWRAYEARANKRLSDNSWHIMVSLMRNSYFPSKTVATWFANYRYLYPDDFSGFVDREIANAQSSRGP